jgi:hypothetical protein
VVWLVRLPRANSLTAVIFCATIPHREEQKGPFDSIGHQSPLEGSEGRPCCIPQPLWDWQANPVGDD